MTRELHFALVDDEDLARRRLVRLLHQLAPQHRLAEFDNAHDFLAHQQRRAFDAVFLDIAMPGLDGIQTASAIQSRTTAVVFATAYDQHAVRAFELAACDYLLKPFDAARLESTLVRIHERLNTAATPELTTTLGPLTRLALPYGKELRIVEISSIVSLRAQGNYVEVESAGVTYLLRATLQGLTQRLPSRDFLRIHRSTMVRIGAVKAMRSGQNGEVQVLLEDGRTLAVARSYRESVKRAFAL